MRAEWIEARPEPVSPQRIAADVARYASLAPDEAFIFTSFHQSPLPTALLLRLAGVAQIAAIGVDYPGSLLDTRVRAEDGIDDMHEVERALRLVAARGFVLPAGDDGGLAYVPLPARDSSLPSRYVAVQPGATVEARAWSPHKLRTLVARLRGAGHEVVVLGSAGEAELTRFVVADSGARDLAGRTSYAQFGRRHSRCAGARRRKFVGHSYRLGPSQRPSCRFSRRRSCPRASRRIACRTRCSAITRSHVPAAALERVRLGDNLVRASSRWTKSSRLCMRSASNIARLRR